MSDTFPAVVEVLRDHGLTPTVCRTLALDLDLLRRLYGGSGTQFFVGNPGGADVRFPLDLHALLFATAPACLLMLHRAGDSANETLVDAKGAVWPEVSPAGTLRRLGENAVFNAVHCPDDAEAAGRELAALVGEAEARRLRALNASGDETPLRLVGPTSFSASAPVFSGAEATSFPAVANRLFRRIAQHIVFAAELDQDTVDDLARADALLDEQRTAIAGTQDTAERIRAARVTVPAITDALSNAATWHGRTFPRKISDRCPICSVPSTIRAVGSRLSPGEAR